MVTARSHDWERLGQLRCVGIYGGKGIIEYLTLTLD